MPRVTAWRGLREQRWHASRAERFSALDRRPEGRADPRAEGGALPGRAGRRSEAAGGTRVVFAPLELPTGVGPSELLGRLHLLSYVSVCFYCRKKSGCGSELFIYLQGKGTTTWSRDVHNDRPETSWQWSQRCQTSGVGPCHNTGTRPPHDPETHSYSARRRKCSHRSAGRIGKDGLAATLVPEPTEPDLGTRGPST